MTERKQLETRLNMLQNEITALEAQAHDVSGEEALLLQGQIDMLRHQEVAMRQQMRANGNGGLGRILTGIFRR